MIRRSLSYKKKIDKWTREKYFHLDIGLESNFYTKIYTAKRREYIAENYLWNINFNIYFVFIFCKWWKWSKVYYAVNYSAYLFCGFRKRKCKPNDWLRGVWFAFFIGYYSPDVLGGAPNFIFGDTIKFLVDENTVQLLLEKTPPKIENF